MTEGVPNRCMSIKRFIQGLFSSNDEDIGTLVRAFPSVLADDVRVVAGILPFEEREILAGVETVRWVDNFVSTINPQEIIVDVGGDTIRLPYRVYFKEPQLAQVESLTPVQQSILHCIYLRHHDGYIRQKHLESLTSISENFVRPFVIQLLGEYVIEILQVINRRLNDDVATGYASFLLANKSYWQRIQSRMISYWDVYYRPSFPKLEQYIGKQIAYRLNVALQTISR
jgi:hypothetical protein